MRDKPLMTYLIVNICLDLGKPAVVDRQSVLRPIAMIILALHWPCEDSGCSNNGIAINIDYSPGAELRRQCARRFAW
jgi:hypothetical protein